MRAYSSRLLGGDASMVLHGGGNTSIKLNENAAAVLYVKGTGSDLARVDASSFTPLRLDGVQAVLGESELNNAAMMQALDACLARRPAPRPSIETLLHGGLPFRCVEHTHADAVLAAMNVDAIQRVHAEVYGDRAPLVPYCHSGHALARACMEAFNARRTGNTIGLILAFHGVVAFGDDVRSSHENMIELVTRAEDYLRARGAWDVAQAPLTPPPAATQALASKLGGKSLAILALGRRSFFTAEDLPLAQSVEFLAAQLSLNVLADDAAEGVTAFLQKRAPKWGDR